MSKDKQEAIEDFKQRNAAAFRAITGIPDIEVSYGSEPAHMAGNRARLPYPNREINEEAIARSRGEADLLAMRLSGHDATKHQRNRPKGDMAPLIFDMLEEARIEASGSRFMEGARGNIAEALEQRYMRLGYHRMKEKADTTLPEVVRLLAREHMTGQEVPPSAKEVVDLWRPVLEEKLEEALDDLKPLMTDQSAYAKAARDLIRQMDVDMGMEEPQDSESDSEDTEESEEQMQDNQTQGQDQNEDGGEQEAEDEEMQAEAGEGSEDAEGMTDDEIQDMMMDDMLPSPGDEQSSDASKGWRPENDLSNVPKEDFYSIFTKGFDEVIRAEDLCDPEELDRLRSMLDQQLVHLQGIIGKLANRLQRRLMAQQTRSWDFDLEEGILDSGRLSRVVTNPTHALSFKWEQDTDFKDTVVTLLLDNSGSMRGRPITIASMSADILARTLERCGVKVEILGFTTKAWKGGQSREQWIEDGKPGNPGRLNDLRHIIYKAADEPYRRGKKNLGLMLREGLLKENIDGEALLWAHDRLLARPEDRRILMVISDGAPVDDSTLSVNSGNYLERHLRDTIDFIENRSPVELCAIGIGHDVTRYYERAVTIVDVEQLGGTMMEQLADLFDLKASVSGGKSQRKSYVS
ncbi:cobaltochelatase subunit CobT [Curvivirga sp.]|uniref:cobaltochelatase subunit CobT n=1 Tax=Curvivirga sp. TaxID=2856848 RepID=UPI003B5A7A26